MSEVDLEALALRVGALEGPCRETDQDIHELIVIESALSGTIYPHCKKYTASIDAAMSLVPEGMGWALYSDGPTYRASAEIGKHPSGGELMRGDWIGEGETPALALCAAALRARASLSRLDSEVSRND